MIEPLLAERYYWPLIAVVALVAVLAAVAVIGGAARAFKRFRARRSPAPPVASMGLSLHQRPTGDRARTRDQDPPKPSAAPTKIAVPSAPPAATSLAEHPLREQLSHAERRLASGASTAEAATQLREVIKAAAMAGQTGIEGAARVALGDLAETSGDMTTACEHWQVARAIFEKANLKTQHADVVDRMRRRGCPTEWVLTDF